MTEAVVLDIDNTLTDDVSWLRVTELMGASAEEHLDIFRRFSAHELSLEAAKGQLVDMWRATGNANRPFWEDLFVDWPLRDGAQELVGYVRSQDWEPAIITGSYDLFAVGIARKLQIARWYANTSLTWDVDGQLTDFDYNRDQAGQKLLHLREFCKTMRIAMTDCIVIGDGDNDVDIFNATGRGIAVGDDSPALLDVAWQRADTLQDVIAILRRSVT